jgi:hypothetical protein
MAIVLAIASFGALGVALWILISTKADISIFKAGNAAAPTNPIVVTVPSPSSPLDRGPVTLVPNRQPLPAGTVADDVARYFELTDNLKKTKELVAHLAGWASYWESGMRAEAAGRAERTNANSSPSAARLRWMNGVEELKRINGALYQNRRFDVSVPELNNPILKAPNEDVFGNDGKTAYEYRVFHFTNINVAKQGASLIDDIEKELMTVRSNIAATPAKRVLQEGSQ